MNNIWFASIDLYFENQEAIYTFLDKQIKIPINNKQMLQSNILSIKEDEYELLTNFIKFNSNGVFATEIFAFIYGKLKGNIENLEILNDTTEVA